MIPQLPDRFELLRPLGQGGMGVVYEAYDRVRDERVALKTIRRADAESVYRLKREFRALADLEHPNLVRLYDLFAEGETCFFTMELVRGLDLRSYIEAQAPKDLDLTLSSSDMSVFDVPLLRRLVAGLARGVEALHAGGLLHRDLKPSNVLVTAEGRVVVLDFGLVADARDAHESTRGTVAGSASYMAPEQARGEPDLTPAADLYAIGVILYELLTGRVPFGGPALLTLAAKQSEDPPRPIELVPAVPKDLDALAMDLLARDPLARPRLSDVFVRLGVQSRPSVPSTRAIAPRLLGRDADLEVLDAAYRITHEGRPSIARVSGRSGIGKSALVHAFTRRVADAHGAVVLGGRCHEHESVPFKGLDGVVDALSRLLAAAPHDELGLLLPPGLASLGTLFPVLRRVGPIRGAVERRALADRPAQRLRAEGLACLRELLRRIGETSPLVVVIDDVHWADEDTARALVELLTGAHPPAMLLLLGARPDAVSPVLRELYAEATSAATASLHRATLELGPVPDEAIREIARAELGEGAQSALVDTVAREARGLPFAAGELVRFVREGEVELGSLEGATSMDAMVLRRAELLDASSRRLLEIVAVAGEPTHAALALRAAELGEGDLATVDQLRVRHFVRKARGGAGTLLDTAHDRIREAILGSLDAEARKRLHHALALAMGTLDDPPHDRLARHLAQAGVRAEARRHAIAAAAEAKEAFAFRRAAELYGMAAGLADEAERAALVDLRGDALALAGRYQEAAEAFLSASELGASPEGRERRRRAAECLLYAGRLDDGLDLLDSVAREVGLRVPKRTLGLVLQLALERLKLFFRGLRFELRPSVEIRGSELERVRTLGAISVVYAPLDPARGLLPMTRHLRAALDCGDVDEIAIALGMEGILMGSAGFIDRAEQVADVLDRLGAETGSTRARAWAKGARGMARCFAGSRTESLRLLEDSFEAFDSFAKSPWELAMAHFLSCFNATYGMSMAPFERLLRFVQEREEQAGPYAELRLRVSGLSPYYLRLGRLEPLFEIDTEAFWAGGTRRDVTFRHVATMFSARAHLYAGDLEAAEKALSAATRALRKSGAMRVVLVRFFVCLVRAALGVMTDRPAEAVAAARVFGRGRTTHERIGSLWLDFLVAIAKKDHARGRECLSALRELANQVGNEELEAGACFGLGHLDRGPEGEPARARYLEMIESSGIVDPDLYFWSVLPIGARPPRTGETRSAWHRERGRAMGGARAEPALPS